MKESVNFVTPSIHTGFSLLFEVEGKHFKVGVYKS